MQGYELDINISVVQDEQGSQRRIHGASLPQRADWAESCALSCFTASPQNKGSGDIPSKQRIFPERSVRVSSKETVFEGNDSA